MPQDTSNTLTQRRKGAKTPRLRFVDDSSSSLFEAH